MIIENTPILLFNVISISKPTQCIIMKLLHIKFQVNAQ